VSDPIIKLIFLVSGTHHTGDPFAKAVDERVVDLCQRFHHERSNPGAVLPAPAVLRFVNFHCHQKTIKVFDFRLLTDEEKVTKAAPGPPARGTMRRKWVKLADFHATGDAAFSPARFVDDTTPFKIVNVYHSVRGAPAKSVLELSIFSHSWEEGPNVITADGRDDPLPAEINGLPIRVTEDTNARVRTDFHDNMGEDPTKGKPPGKFPRTGGKDALKEFKAAFDDRASFIVFGCNGQDSMRDDADHSHVGNIASTAGQVINQAYVLPIKALAARMSIGPDDPEPSPEAVELGRILKTGKVLGDQQVLIDMGQELDLERHEIDEHIKNHEHHGKIFDDEKRPRTRNCADRRTTNSTRTFSKRPI
jgi:hypothetical protein